MRRARFSIAGLMGIVLVAAVGLGALRGASQGWFGAIYLLTRAILGLAALGAIYGRGASRAWWLGFCLFGWGYEFLVTPQTMYRGPSLPTTLLLVAVRPLFGHPARFDPGAGGPFDAAFTGRMADYVYLRIGDDLWAIAAALLGGVLARILYARSADRSGPSEAAPGPSTGRPSRARWIRPAIIGWAGLVLVTSAAAIRSPWNAGFWAGLTFLLTFGLLGMLGLGALYTRGRRRPAWVGAGLLGAGYLILVFSRSPYVPLPTGQLLHALRLWVPALASGTAAANARIRDTLERPIPMNFPDPTPLEDVLAYVKTATATPTEPGLPVYLDPIGLQEAERTSGSTISIDLQTVALRASLRACLKQIGMDYVVRDGILWISSMDSIDRLRDPFYEAEDNEGILYHNRDKIVVPSEDLEDPYLIVGHCLLAVLVAGFGAVAAPMIADACREPPGPAPPGPSATH